MSSITVFIFCFELNDLEGSAPLPQNQCFKGKETGAKIWDHDNSVGKEPISLGAVVEDGRVIFVSDRKPGLSQVLP